MDFKTSYIGIFLFNRISAMFIFAWRVFTYILRPTKRWLKTSSVSAAFFHSLNLSAILSL